MHYFIFHIGDGPKVNKYIKLITTAVTYPNSDVETTHVLFKGLEGGRLLQLPRLGSDATKQARRFLTNGSDGNGRLLVPVNQRPISNEN